MSRLTCIIIDDEPLAQKVIENYLKNFSFIQLIGKFENALSSVKSLKEKDVDLIFLDISMPFISGIDFIKTLQTPPKIILTTAHEEFAVESYELSVLDYLLKPISFERFVKAINKLEIHPPEETKHEMAELGSDTFIYVRHEKKNIKILLSEILFIESLKDYIKIHTVNRTIVTQISISAIETRLPDNFLRIHRSFIIAKDKITAYTQHDLEIGKHQIPIGRNFKSVVQKIFKSI